MHAQPDPAALFHSVSDECRLRLLRLLAREELNVQELVAATGLSQPRVSKHLGVLRDHGWLVQRKEGTRSWQKTVEPAGFPGGEDLFRTVLGAAGGLVSGAEDDGRLAAVLAGRDAGSQDFFAAIADRWDEFRAQFEHPDLRVGMVAALAAPGIRVLDIGTGTGALLPILAGAAGTVVAIDNSAAMLARATGLCRQQGLDRVRLCNADAVGLPFRDACFDACNCAMVLHHVARPAQAVREMARVIKPGGRLTVTTFCSHDQEWMRRELAHQWLGFEREEIERFLTTAGLTVVNHLRRGPVTTRENGLPGGGKVDWPEVQLVTAARPMFEDEDTIEWIHKRPNQGADR